MTTALRLRSAARAVGTATLNFYNDRCHDLAAIVAFYTLLSLGPTLYLVVAAVGLFVDEAAVLERATERLAFFFPGMAVEGLAGIAAGLPAKSNVVVLAIPGLVWVASSALSALDHAVNVATGTAEHRSFWRSRLTALIALSAAGGLLGLSAVSGAVLPGLSRLRPWLDLPWAPAASSVSAVAVPAVAFTCFLILYKTLPLAPLRWRPAMIGAGIALALWELSRTLFAAVLLHSPAFGLFTGALAGIVALLMWIYLAVGSILFGAELAAVLDRHRRAPAPDIA